MAGGCVVLGTVLVIVASSWFHSITLPTLMMHGQTQIKLTLEVRNNHAQWYKNHLSQLRSIDNLIKGHQK